ncbi:uncharacterized protein [Triticum aestivum]|uniref:uncharacterized protein isoform X3 n=2 Tax=Triticinae TaxID=1648030 RepID=UPI00098A771F|nr:uncharacterized protein LOC123170362 isoform X3 [Triticum aestivum]XP_044444151.1 uncharacterized protein LOC123170362 isoform X3 [Triticum aestivum]XP_044444153.1 uncharacterized protein LOC123170362 isoform X3 [Triticum aestivum]XP_044444154.1 uncharacterized protein LOC123170362 isoform X3 [Triticum aestivum]XP_044444155.1 uncharacterized protein LOC123170362 isoform X3 [Triticum aestivum]XP_044444156.1 uncharacterized protein LOC123170362 isoform X3 [Triticum aestivum]XP_044444157.1 un
MQHGNKDLSDVTHVVVDEVHEHTVLYIASCSMDKIVRVLEISKGTCIRVVYGVSSQLCICFHPAINFSTGRVISKLTYDNAVTALDIDHTGQLIFAGDAQGYIYTISVNSHTGSLSRTHKNKSCKIKSSVTTIRIATNSHGYLTLICSLKLASPVQNIRASFCPLLSLEKGEFIGIDEVVYIPKGTRLSSNGSSLESRGKFARLI